MVVTANVELIIGKSKWQREVRVDGRTTQHTEPQGMANATRDIHRHSGVYINRRGCTYTQLNRYTRTRIKLKEVTSTK